MTFELGVTFRKPLPRGYAILVFLCIITLNTAHAQFTGHTVSCDRRYPTDTRVPSKYGQQVIAAKGSYFLAGPSGIKVTGTQITITLSALYNKYTFKNTTYNGYRLTATDGTTPAITSVTIDDQTHITGFDASRISFTSEYVQVNLAGLTFGLKDRVVLDVAFAPSNGAPSSLALLPPREKGIYFPRPGRERD